MSAALAPVKGQRPTCTHHGHEKVTYPSELTAATAGTFYNQRPYKCSVCDGWHLTTQGRKTKSRRANARKVRRKLGSYQGLK